MGTEPNVPFTRLPHYGSGAGFSTPFGRVLSPFGQSFYVSSTKLDTSDMEKRRSSTLANALRLCKAGRGDTVYIAPGHEENVVDATMLDNLVAGVAIIGASGGAMPKFTFTATASSWTVDQANVSISGIHFDLTGIDAVVAGLAVTASDCEVSGCRLDCETTSLQAVDVITLAAGADRAVISGNTFNGDGADDVTTAVNVAAGADGVKVVSNAFVGGWHATQGAVYVAGAALRLLVADNDIANVFSGNGYGIGVADAASTGIFSGNRITTTNTGSANATGIVFDGTGSLVRCIENYHSDEARASGVLTPTVAS